MIGGAHPRALRWARRAEADLEAIHDYIADDDPVAAGRWLEKLLTRAAQIAPLPFTGRMVPEFGREELREVLLRTCRIVYRITPGEVQVITVFEGHRLFPADVDTDPDP
ncbi:MAG: type II toxin-antitoxin system RelE/ParE family toxin [Minicystis sp.]